ncbi:hypothetical protein BDF19DRAFT_425265 [Syncephalis fuscata]|nr:hypothetical protein BDF19DRAFT_425265 [Syncephalis fuscata]
MTLAIDEEPPFMKLLAVMDRLDLNRFATIIMYSGGAGVRLATSSRFLRSRLYCNKELWKRVYFQSFLNGYHRIKEWDFVYCCARNYFDINSIPMESDALLCDVDWYDVYRQRIITEQNWRRDRFNEVTAHLPENAKIVLLKPPKECATILPYYTEIYIITKERKSMYMLLLKLLPLWQISKTLI